MYYGMYSYGHQGGVWTDNKMHDNIVYGERAEVRRGFELAFTASSPLDNDFSPSCWRVTALLHSSTLLH